MTEHTEGDAPGVISEDAPPGETYSREQAARLLALSPRRITQLAKEGRLAVVQESPLRLDAQSVHEERARRRSTGRDLRATVPPDDPQVTIAAEVARITEMLERSYARQIEATELSRAQAAAERDRLREDMERLRDEARSEAERLRAEVAAERERAQVERERAERERERAEAWARRRWWQPKPRDEE